MSTRSDDLDPQHWTSLESHAGNAYTHTHTQVQPCLIVHRSHICAAVCELGTCSINRTWPRCSVPGRRREVHGYKRLQLADSENYKQKKMGSNKCLWQKKRVSSVIFRGKNDFLVSIFVPFSLFISLL